MRPIRSLRHLLALSVAAASLISSAQAQTATDVILDLPDNVDLAAVIIRGRDLVDTPAAAVADILVAESPVAAGTAAALGVTAAQLDLTTPELIERLVKHRFVLASAEDNADRRSWAIVFDTDARTHATIRNAMFSKPRGTIQGLPAYNLSNGAFRAATTRAPGRTRNPLVRTFLAPASASEFLERVVATDRRPARGSTLRGTPNAENLVLLDDNTLAVVASIEAARDLGLVERRPAPPAGERPRGFAFNFAAMVTGDQVVGTLIAHADAVLGPQHATTDIDPWPVTTFDTLAEPATLAIIEHERLGLGLAGRAFQGLKPPDLDPEPDDAPLNDPGPKDPEKDARLAIALFPPVEGATAPEVFMAFEVADVAQAARAADASLAERFGAKADADSEPAPLAEPAAVRKIDLAPVLGPFNRFAFGDNEAAFTWTVRRSPRAEALHPGHAPGWWTMSIGADQNRFFDSTALFTGERDDVQALPWVSMGLVRPNALLADAQAAGNLPVIALGDPRYAALLEAFQRTERVKWRLLRTTNGLVIGAVGIDFTQDER